MINMFNFIKKRNYLSREELINSVDSNKIWSKSMTLSEIKELLEYLEIKISKYDFDIDKNFIMNSRRKELKSIIKERLLQNNNNNINELVSESLFNFWEFVSDEYPGNFLLASEDLGLTIKELDTMDNEYRKKGIICSQERDIILEIIMAIKTHINKKEM